MPRSFTKDFKTYEEQLDILRSRNLPCFDTNRCLDALKTYGYYRLSAYWYPFRIRDESHIEGIDTPSENVFPGFFFDDIVDVYEFDRAFRNVINGSLDHIELSIRVAIAYQMGQYERFAFENIALFSDSCTKPSHWDPSLTHFQSFRNKLEKMQAESKETFVHHFEEQYDGRLPVWASIETWDFGTIKACFDILRPEDRLIISSSLGVVGTKALASWIGPFRVVRNMCAHHSRLNRRAFTDTPGFPKRPETAHIEKMDAQMKHRLYPIIVAMIELLQVSGRSGDLIRGIRGLSEQAKSLPAVGMADYGFPAGWENMALWEDQSPISTIEKPHSRRKMPFEAMRKLVGAIRRY